MNVFKRMGVMNVTPDSFSDGAELSAATFKEKLCRFGPVDALDIGAESTAPMNSPITSEEEWERLRSVLPFLKNLNCLLSIDTYHPETIFRVAHDWKGPLIWNDVSGKFDSSVMKYLAANKDLSYVFCHNLAPSRDLTGRHMDYISKNEGNDFFQELAEFFAPHIHPQVIFDPCLGFSKTYGQNWYVLEHFSLLQKLVPHDRWLIGFSRKSFLRKKYSLTLDSRDELDRVHKYEAEKLLPTLTGEVWLRTHRPEIL
jgi:dihydropteroate synthase